MAKAKNILNYIEPINVNGLRGRMLCMPAPKHEEREIMFVYGHHSSLERWWGVIQNLNKYGGVTMPDLPGFGGMDSLYKIGKSASLDNLADYLATFIRLRYKKHQKFIIVGLSLGFVVATRMLQRHPELVKNVSLMVSFAGFAHHDDFNFKPSTKRLIRLGSSFFNHKITAGFFRYFVINSLVLKTFYKRTSNAHERINSTTGVDEKAIIQMEIDLWHDNDVRTYMKTTHDFITLDNCKKRINLPVYHIAVDGDRYFNNNLVEQHMRVIFSDYKVLAKLKDVSHAPSVIADAKAAAPYIPLGLRQFLRQLD